MCPQAEYYNKNIENTGDYLLTEIKGNVKFDVIVGNPPYQTQSDASNTKTQPVWDKFVEKSLSMLIDGGHLCFVHPAGWRNVSGMFEETKKLLLSKNIKHLEMYDKEQGIKTFGARTMYDWYVVQNTKSSTLTSVKTQDGKIVSVNLTKLPFIPSGMFDEITSLIAKDGEERVEILYNRSAYGSDKENIHKTPTKKYKYPCVYMVRVGDELALMYSNTIDNGHFGIPKFIWGNGGYNMGSVVDVNGKYGLTQFAYAIVDFPENLPFIKQAFDSEKFKALMKCCDGGDSNINRKAIATFRKDFWKSFV